MSHMLVLGVLLSASAAASPVPKTPKETDQQRLERLFGFPTDPDKDCKFTLTENKLRVQLPAKAHSIDPCRKLANVPRVVRRIEGDFSAQVRVTLIHPGDLKPAPEKPAGLFGAGLILTAGEDTFAYHGHRLFLRADGPLWQGQLGFRDPGDPVRVDTGSKAFASTFALLRLTRTGGTLRMEAWSKDQGWEEVAKKTIRLPDHVSIGVFASNHTETPFAAEFEDFTVTPAKPGK